MDPDRRQILRALAAGIIRPYSQGRCSAGGKVRQALDIAATEWIAGVSYSVEDREAVLIAPIAATQIGLVAIDAGGTASPALYFNPTPGRLHRPDSSFGATAACTGKIGQAGSR
jgi:hypothetical protein